MGTMPLAIGREDLVVKLTDESSGLPLALQEFSIATPLLRGISAGIKSSGTAEFMRSADQCWWFCQIELLGRGGRSYLLKAKDRTRVRYRQITRSLLTGIGFLLADTIGILFVARRYVRRLFAEAHRRVETSCDREPSGRVPGDGKVELVSEEFSRRNGLPCESRYRLPQGSERNSQLESRKLNGDRLAAIATLASGFAHQIGTPLGVARGLAEMLLTDTFDRSEVTKNLEIIIAQIDQITRMVKLLLNFGLCRSAIRVTSDVRAISERTIQLFKPEALRRGVEVIANLGSRPLMVDCDPDQLQQVFVNLVSNALDAMTPGGGQLWVNSVADRVHGNIKLSFEDTGPGVPIAIRDRVFDPFFTTKGTGQGDGLGLAVSQSIIGDHDGELTLEQHTHGACFLVTLPASKPLEPEPRR